MSIRETNEYLNSVVTGLSEGMRQPQGIKCYIHDLDKPDGKQVVGAYTDAKKVPKKYRSAFLSCQQLGDVITMGTTVVEPERVWKRRQGRR